MIKVATLLIAVTCALIVAAGSSSQPNMPNLKVPRQQASDGASRDEASAVHLSIATVGPMLGPPTDRYQVGDQVPITISMTNTSSEPAYACVSSDLYQDLPKLQKNGQLVPYAKWQADWLADAQRNQTCQHEDLPESTAAQDKRVDRGGLSRSGRRQPVPDWSGVVVRTANARRL